MELVAVEPLTRGSCCGGVGELDEPEAAGAAGRAVGGKNDVDDLACFREQAFDLVT